MATSRLQFQCQWPFFIQFRRTIHQLGPCSGKELRIEGTGVLISSERQLKRRLLTGYGCLNASQKTHWLFRSQRTGLICCCVHTQTSCLLASKKSQEVRQSGRDQEHGSVLMQFVQKKEEPKALTTGAKGKDIGLVYTLIYAYYQCYIPSPPFWGKVRHSWEMAELQLHNW